MSTKIEKTSPTEPIRNGKYKLSDNNFGGKPKKKDQKCESGANQSFKEILNGYLKNNEESAKTR